MGLLIFDCDGVLVDSETIAESVLHDQLAAWLPDLAAEHELSGALGMTTAAILRRWMPRSSRPPPLLGSFNQHFFQ